jgi:hypothetical protein
MAVKGIYLHAMRIGDPGHKGGDVRFQRATLILSAKIVASLNNNASNSCISI